jgi:DNA-binding CsgD family transcriptional regulator
MPETREITDMFLRGIPVTDIAKKLGCSRETVYLHLRKMPNFHEVAESMSKIRKRQRRNKYQDKMPEVKRMAKEGKGGVEIAEALSIPYKVVKSFLRGTPYDNTHIRKQLRNEKIWELYRDGMTQEELADKFGLAQSTISHIVRKTTNYAE